MKSEQINELVNGMFSVLPAFHKKIYEIGEQVILKEAITIQQLHLMFMIKKQNKITTTELAQKLSVSKSNITGLSDKLVAQTFVERIADSKDRRVSYLQLTEAGNDYLNTLIHEVKEVVGKKFEELADEDILLFAETMKNMSVLLKKLK